MPDAALTAAELALTLQMWGSGKVKVVLRKRRTDCAVKTNRLLPEGEQILTWKRGAACFVERGRPRGSMTLRLKSAMARELYRK